MFKFRAAALAAIAALAIAAAPAHDDHKPAEEYLMAIGALLEAQPDSEADPAAFQEHMGKAATVARDFLLHHPDHAYTFRVFQLYPQLLGESGKSGEEVETALASLEKEAANPTISVMFAINSELASVPDDATAADVYAALKRVAEKHPDSSLPLGEMAGILTYAEMPVEQKVAEANRLIATGKLDPQSQGQLEGWLKQAAAIGQPVSFQFTDLRGNEVDTSEWKGKVILVDFWATWCGPCVAEMPRVKKIYEQYHGQGLEIVGISCDQSAAPLQRFVEARDIPWTQWPPVNGDGWHPKAAEWGVTGIPTMFLIDKNGNLRSVDARQNMEEMIPKLLAEEM